MHVCWFYKIWHWRWVGISVITGSLFYFQKLILHHARAVTAACRGSTVADLDLRTTRQPEPCILWSRITHILPYHTLISIVWALVCATVPLVWSSAKASAILNESVTAVTASRFSPVNYAIAACANFVTLWWPGNSLLRNKLSLD